ncbi:hypothetical protein PsYK624_154030 [Phanerochaete sordida]|uniref:Uncharacterized protein n=1 Tax=Phanerochaete sordida TaxID=48140 RepID=A0A9P3GQ74_9APHY|nr:hypothetical protein PsYK624_154030 [Phanerochaete sordida]
MNVGMYVKYIKLEMAFPCDSPPWAHLILHLLPRPLFPNIISVDIIAAPPRGAPESDKNRKVTARSPLLGLPRALPFPPWMQVADLRVRRCHFARFNDIAPFVSSSLGGRGADRTRTGGGLVADWWRTGGGLVTDRRGGRPEGDRTRTGIGLFQLPDVLVSSLLTMGSSCARLDLALTEVTWADANEPPPLEIPPVTRTVHRLWQREVWLVAHRSNAPWQALFFFSRSRIARQRPSRANGYLGGHGRGLGLDGAEAHRIAVLVQAFPRNDTVKVWCRNGRTLQYDLLDLTIRLFFEISAVTGLVEQITVHMPREIIDYSDLKNDPLAVSDKHTAAFGPTMEKVVVLLPEDMFPEYDHSVRARLPALARQNRLEVRARKLDVVEIQEGMPREDDGEDTEEEEEKAECAEVERELQDLNM